ncbi:uncharacterized protein LOC104415380 [Eucalyptus grandis]|uniref:Uncharacterized protein n=2 Tax=Eucalyptus grandis TaxID=71139 RepID=A0ACC3JWG8_EUCGR|nr:uncharacterized protein LOC104415380 [Eucalyptus grandis]KAK3418314.1 hypothetical protein EUGRSUZ_H04256 [Eucalyptus grandis]
MVEDLFEGLPPPSSNPQEAQAPEREQVRGGGKPRAPSPVPPPPPPPSPPPRPALKSALKRPKSDEPNPPPGAELGKRLRFKTHTDASEAQVIDAMKKIASHIRNPTKLGKASKLAIQLIQAGSVKPGTRDYFFAILEAAMSLSTACTDQSVRADYHALFSAAQDAAEHLSDKQKNQLTTWTIQAVVANDLFTDDSFVFSRTAGRIKDTISNLPVATEADDIEEAAALEAEKESTDLPGNQELPPDNHLGANNEGELDPFGLDALIPSKAKKDENSKGKKDMAAKMRKEEEDEHKRFLKSEREALIVCLEIAARRYKTPWCQTVIDILVKHAFDNVSRFTSKQREAITKLWASIREQQNRRKQGKSVSGKLDVNAFEWLQQKYSTEKISIRHSVGGSGDRRAQQWLG